MSDSIDALRCAHDEARRRIQKLSDDQFAADTPCDGWTVRDLLLHMAGGCSMSVAVLHGEPWGGGAAYSDAFAGDSAALVAAWEKEAAGELAAFSEPGALERIVQHPFAGAVPADRFIGMRTGDSLLHAWDLARATGGDETLDPELVETVWTGLQPLAPMIGSIGFFGSGPSGDVPESAPLQTRLIDLTGRRP